MHKPCPPAAGSFGSQYGRLQPLSEMSKNKAIWLAQLLFRRGQLSRDAIEEAWAACDEHGRRMAASTFYDNRKLLFYRYGIRISCANGLYRLDIHEGREQDFLRQLFHGNGNSDEKEGNIIQEPHAAGYEHVGTLSSAIDKRMCVSLKYAPFDKAPFSTMLSPYCLRMFRGRCYVVGFSSAHGSVRTFALDRMATVTPTPTPQSREMKFDARKYFEGCFGVYGGEGKRVEHVVILADDKNAPFLRTMQLHSSQRETQAAGDNGKYTARFELDVKITDDFVHELLYYGDGIKVEAPQSLRRLVAGYARRTLAAYKD